MISRRALIGSAGAAILAGGAGVAIELSERNRTRASTELAPNFSVEALGSARHYQLADFAGGLLFSISGQRGAAPAGSKCLGLPKPSLDTIRED